MKLIYLLHNYIVKYYAFFVLTYALLSVLFALILEYIFGFLPCFLCKMQRIPLYFIIILGFFNFASKRKCERNFTILAIFALFILAIISFYHAGIEYGIFNNFIDCVSDKAGFENVSELREYLTNKISVPCEEVSFRFLLSLSGWNFFLTLILGIIGLRHIYLSEKNKNV